jgi:hypothetical protein
MEYNVIDNFLPKDVFEEIQKVFMGPQIPWFYNNSVLTVGADEKYFQFTHTIFNNWKPDSQIMDVIVPILSQVNPKAWFRIKANLGTRTLSNEETGFHTDFEFPCTTAIFYLNTNNGYTVFEDGTKVESIANRFVEFNSELKHSGVTQTDTNTRVLINFNYTKEGGY